MIKVLVCGGRDFNDYGLLADTLVGLLGQYDPKEVTIISGHARGADKLGEQFANANECKLLIFPADWDKQGKAAGFIRNQRMIEEGKPDLVVAFPTKTSRGTFDMINKAKKAGLPVTVVGP